MRRVATADEGRTPARGMRRFAMWALCFTLAACGGGGRSESLFPVAGYGCACIIDEDDEYVFVVVTDVPVDSACSVLPSGDKYIAETNGRILWLLGGKYRLDEGRLFCVRAAEGSPEISQLDYPLPHFDGDLIDQLEAIVTDEEVRAELDI